MKRLLYLILILLSFNSYSQSAIDSLSSIDQFGRVRDGIIAQNIIDVLNTDPSGVKLTENEKQYVRTIVNGLYTIGVWQKCKAVYGFVGGNEWKHKWNWKDMRDLAAGYRAEFINGATHNSNGVTTNGINQYIETNFNASLLTTRNTHLSIYLRSVGTSNSAHISGVTNSSIPTSTLLFINRPNATTFLSASSANYQAVSPVQTSLSGYYLGYSNSTDIYLYKNGQNITNTRILGSSTAFPNLTVVIGGSKTSTGVASFSNINLSYYSIGDGLTDNQAIQASNIITFAQSILNRR